MRFIEYHVYLRVALEEEIIQCDAHDAYMGDSRWVGHIEFVRSLGQLKLEDGV